VARGKNRRRRDRDDSSQARRSLPTSSSTYQPRSRSVRTIYTVDQFGDLTRSGTMFISPTIKPPARQRRNRIVASPNVNLGRVAPYKAPSLVGFQSPSVIQKPGPPERRRPEKTICESRQQRREVMFASGKGGKRGQKPPVWTQLSKKRCK